ncbi:MAG: PrcB protein, partial [Dehalococcoidia bacterium]|nr:PrcB protein [Dehalococcoidia bacterium]
QVRLKLDEPDPKMAYAQVIVRPTAVAEVGIGALKQRGLLTLEFLDQKGRKLARVDTEI